MTPSPVLLPLHHPLSSWFQPWLTRGHSNKASDPASDLELKDRDMVTSLPMLSGTVKVCYSVFKCLGCQHHWSSLGQNGLPFKQHGSSSDGFRRPASVARPLGPYISFSPRGKGGGLFLGRSKQALITGDTLRPNQCCHCIAWDINSTCDLEEAPSSLRAPGTGLEGL